MPIGEYVIGITLVRFKITTVVTSRDQRLTEKYQWSNLATLVAYAVLLYSPLIATVYVVVLKRETLEKFVPGFNLSSNLSQSLSRSSLPTGGTLCYCCLSNLRKWSTMIQMTYSLIDTSCEVIKHQSTIARFGDSLDKKGIDITPDPFGAGAYNLQSINTL